MSIEVKVPQLPESVTDATLVTWHKRAGDAVRRDENLVDLETDKVVLEVPAPSDGVLTEIKIDDGATVVAGQVLAVLEPGEGPAESAAQSSEKSPPPAVEKAAQASESVQSAQSTESVQSAQSAERLGPAARRLVEEHDLDPTAIAGTGRDGRVSKADVLNYLKSGQNAGDGSEEEPIPAVPDAGVGRTEQRVPMTRLRTRIAERLVEAQHTAAMLTTFNEIDMTAVMSLRKRYQETFQAQYGIKLGFMSFFVKASVEALRRFPVLNASLDEGDIVYHEYFDIGVAVSTDRGLIVPIIRDADSLSYAEIEETISDFGERARSGGITMDDLTGGTFTLTNGGIFGSLMSTPILNPPQSGILGMHKIQERPVAIDGELEVRPMMYTALTYDHRLVDGKEAVQFLVALKKVLEDPARLVLQI